MMSLNYQHHPNAENLKQFLKSFLFYLEPNLYQWIQQLPAALGTLRWHSVLRCALVTD